jgi:DNA gyrase subunit B
MGPLIIHDDPVDATTMIPEEKYVSSSLEEHDDLEDLDSSKIRGKDLENKVDMVRKLKAGRKSGTQVTFLPDIQVFKGENGKPSISFDSSRLRSRMDELAFLNPGLVLTLQDKMASGSGSVEIFHHAGGLLEYVEMLCNTKTPLFGEKEKAKSDKMNSSKNGRGKKGDGNLNDPLRGLLSDDGGTIFITGTVDTPDAPPVTVTAALRWSSDMYTETILSFTNNIRTRDGGSHVDGLKASLTRAVNGAAKRLGRLKEGQANLPGEFIREGLTAIISVSVVEPEFEGQTK